MRAARKLILLLQDLATREAHPDEQASVQARLQQVLEDSVGAELSGAFEYATYEVDWANLGPKIIQGLATVDSGLLLTEIVDQIAAMEDSELGDLLADTGLTPREGRAAFYAAYWILNSLEWESRDRAIPPEFPLDKKESMLASSLRSLQSFRDTGEP